MTAAEATTKPGLESVDLERIMELLPHRPPMLLIERIIDIVPNDSATGLKMLNDGDSVFNGHFPGHPIMPGVLIIEAMAQTSGALVMHSMGAKAGDKLVYFMSVDRARYRHPVVPGNLLRLNVKLQRARKPVWRFAAEAYVNETLCAEAEYSAMIVDKSERLGQANA